MRTAWFLVVLMVVLSGSAFGQTIVTEGGKDVTAEAVADAQRRAAAAEAALEAAKAELAAARNDKNKAVQERSDARNSRTSALRRGDGTAAEQARQVASAAASRIAEAEARISSIEASLASLRADHHRLAAEFENFRDQPFGGSANQAKADAWLQDRGYRTEGQMARKYGLTPVDPPASAGTTPPPSGASDTAPKEGQSMWTTLIIVVGAIIALAVIAAVVAAALGFQLLPAGWVEAQRRAAGLGRWTWGPNVRGTYRASGWTRNSYWEETRRRG